MDGMRLLMDKNKILATPLAMNPRVRFANYFRVEDGTWPQHDIVDLELCYVLQGRFAAEDAEHPRTIMESGDILLIRSGHPCEFVRLSPPGEAFISCIHFELIAGKSYAAGDYILGPLEPWVVHTKSDWLMVDLFRRCAAEWAGHGRYRERMMDAIFGEIWVRLMRMAETASEERGYSARMEQMVMFIRRLLPGPVSRNDLAGEFRMTPEHINYLFKKELGMTPTQFIHRERCLMAAQLLSEGRNNVAETARAAGFSDPYHFSRVFRKTMGRPPSTFI